MTDKNMRLAQKLTPTPPPSRSDVERYGRFAETVAVFKFALSRDEVAIGPDSRPVYITREARRRLGLPVEPSSQWTSSHLVQLFDSERNTYDWLIEFVREARKGDIQAQNALADTAPASCNRNWQCFADMMSESARMIRARAQRGDIGTDNLRSLAEKASFENSGIRLTDAAESALIIPHRSPGAAHVLA